MGQQIECVLRYREQNLAGTAYLESDHVLFRGPQRLKFLFKELTTVRAQSGILRLEFASGPAELELGAAAEKWADRILNPPSRLHKLGVKTGMTVRLVGEFDADFLAELETCHLEPAADRADLIFLAAEGKAKLQQIRKLVASMNPAGALWVIYPKGIATLREMDVIAAGRAARLKDSKVASFSLTHTGLKFVIPLLLRRDNAQ